MALVATSWLLGRTRSDSRGPEAAGTRATRPVHRSAACAPSSWDSLWEQSDSKRRGHPPGELPPPPHPRPPRMVVPGVGPSQPHPSSPPRPQTVVSSGCHTSYPTSKGGRGRTPLSKEREDLTLALLDLPDTLPCTPAGTGPGRTPTAQAFLGSHSRGFRALSVCRLPKGGSPGAVQGRGRRARLRSVLGVCGSPPLALVMCGKVPRDRGGGWAKGLRAAWEANSPGTRRRRPAAL